MSNEKEFAEMDKELDEMLKDLGVTYDPNMTREDMDVALDELLGGEPVKEMSYDEMDTILDKLMED